MPNGVRNLARFFGIDAQCGQLTPTMRLSAPSAAPLQYLQCISFTDDILRGCLMRRFSLRRLVLVSRSAKDPTPKDVTRHFAVEGGIYTCRSAQVEKIEEQR